MDTSAYNAEQRSPSARFASAIRDDDPPTTNNAFPSSGRGGADSPLLFRGDASSVLSALLRRSLFNVVGASSSDGSSIARTSPSASSSSSSVRAVANQVDNMLQSTLLGAQHSQEPHMLRSLLFKALAGENLVAAPDTAHAWLHALLHPPVANITAARANASTKGDTLSQQAIQEVAAEEGSSVDDVEAAISVLERMSLQEFEGRLNAALGTVSDHILSLGQDPPAVAASTTSYDTHALPDRTETRPYTLSPAVVTQAGRRGLGSSVATALGTPSSPQPPTQTGQWRAESALKGHPQPSASTTTTTAATPQSAPFFLDDFAREVLEAVVALHASDSSSGPRPTYTLPPASPSSRLPLAATHSQIVRPAPPITTIIRRGSGQGSSSQLAEATLDSPLGMAPRGSGFSERLSQLLSYEGDEDSQDDGGRPTSAHILRPATHHVAGLPTAPFDVRVVDPALHQAPSASFYPSREAALSCKGYHKQYEHVAADGCSSSLPIANRCVILATDKASLAAPGTYRGSKMYNTFPLDGGDANGGAPAAPAFNAVQPLMRLLKAIPEPHTRNLYVVVDPALPVHPFFDIDADGWDATPFPIDDEGGPSASASNSLQHTLIQPLLLSQEGCRALLPTHDGHMDIDYIGQLRAWTAASVEAIAWLVSSCVWEATQEYFGIASPNDGSHKADAAAISSAPVVVLSSSSSQASTPTCAKLSLHVHIDSSRTIFANIAEHRLFVEEVLLGRRPTAYPRVVAVVASLIGRDAGSVASSIDALLRQVVDASIYTKWRLLRLPYCCKGYSFGVASTEGNARAPSATTTTTTVGRMSASAVVSSLDAQDAFLQTASTLNNLITHAPDVLGCAFGPDGALRYLLPVVPATSDDGDGATALAFTPLRDLLLGGPASSSGSLMQVLAAALIHPLGPGGDSATLLALSGVSSRLERFLVPVIRDRLVTLVAQSELAVDTSSIASSAADEESLEERQRAHNVASHIRGELGRVQRLSRIIDELCSVGASFGTGAASPSITFPAAVADAGMGVGAETQLNALLDTQAWADTQMDEPAQVGSRDDQHNALTSLRPTSFTAAVFGSCPEGEGTTPSSPAQDVATSLGTLLHFDFLEGVSNVAAPARRSGAKRSRDPTTTIASGSTPVATLPCLPPWSVQGLETAALYRLSLAAGVGDRSIPAHSPMRSSGVGVVTKGCYSLLGLTEDETNLLLDKGLINNAHLPPPVIPPPPFPSGRRITIMSPAIRRALSMVWRCLHSAYDFPLADSEDGVDPSSPTVTGTSFHKSTSSGGQLTSHTPGDQKNTPIAPWSLGTCQYEDNGIFRSYYVFQKCNRYCVCAARSHKATFGQLYVTFNSIKYRCYSNDCYRQCTVIPWRAATEDGAAASYPRHDQLLALRGLLFPEFSRVDITQRYRWIVEAPKHYLPQEDGGDEGDASSEMGGDSVSGRQHDEESGGAMPRSTHDADDMGDEVHDGPSVGGGAEGEEEVSVSQ